MPPRPCLFATLSAVLLPSALEAQARPVEHLLRLSLQPGAALHYRNTLVTEEKLPDAKGSVVTTELTIECNVGSSKEGKADLQQIVRRLIFKLRRASAKGS
jgi:hypothetical protein